MEPEIARERVSDVTGVQVFRESGISALRFVIAFLVVWATYRLMKLDADVSGAWQAVFLLVTGFYFKDRPAVERASQRIVTLRPTKSIRWWQEMAFSADVELFLQFVLALTLLGGTWIFLYTIESPTEVPAAWIGATLLAVGFYFKAVRIASIERFHRPIRTLLALLTVIGTLLLIPSELPSGRAQGGGFSTSRVVGAQLDRDLPSEPQKGTRKAILSEQWIAIVLIVVAFYFKETGNEPEA
jgi:hypothetical protein